MLIFLEAEFLKSVNRGIASCFWYKQKDGAYNIYYYWWEYGNVKNKNKTREYLLIPWDKEGWFKRGTFVLECCGFPNWLEAGEGCRLLRMIIQRSECGCIFVISFYITKLFREPKVPEISEIYPRAGSTPVNSFHLAFKCTWVGISDTSLAFLNVLVL